MMGEQPSYKGVRKMDPEGLVTAIIEIPQGSVNKYEFDQKTQRFRLDRVLYSPIHYPADYGFIPETLAADGDPLDILVFISHPTFPGCEIPARIIGGLVMADEKGDDQKILSVAAVDPRFGDVDCLAKVPAHTLKEIEYFFSIYKDLEGKSCQVTGWLDRADAIELWQQYRIRSEEPILT